MLDRLVLLALWSQTQCGSQPGDGIAQANWVARNLAQALPDAVVRESELCANSGRTMGIPTLSPCVRWRFHNLHSLTSRSCAWAIRSRTSNCPDGKARIIAIRWGLHTMYMSTRHENMRSPSSRRSCTARKSACAPLDRSYGMRASLCSPPLTLIDGMDRALAVFLQKVEGKPWKILTGQGVSLYFPQRVHHGFMADQVKGSHLVN